MDKPTPTPWLVERHDDEDGTIAYEIWNHAPAHYHRICTVADYSGDNPPAKANAALIVRAVNSHEALKEALRDLLRYEAVLDDDDPKLIAVRAQARAALALAEAP